YLRHGMMRIDQYPTDAYIRWKTPNGLRELYFTKSSRFLRTVAPITNSPSTMHPLTRRQLLHNGTFGLASVALAYLLNPERLLGAPPKPELEPAHYDLKPKSPHFPARAKAMISLFMQGGPSHMDLLDPKPKLAELDGKPFPGTIKYDNAAQASSKVLGSPWKFAKHGKCGTEVSELMPYTARIVDDLAVVRSMHTGVNNHVQGIHALNTGR